LRTSSSCDDASTALAIQQTPDLKTPPFFQLDILVKSN